MCGVFKVATNHVYGNTPKGASLSPLFKRWGRDGVIAERQSGSKWKRRLQIFSDKEGGSPEKNFKALAMVQ